GSRMVISDYSIILTLSEADRELLEAFADEHEIDDPADAIRLLLHEYVALSDALWDEKFAHSGEALDRLSRQVDAEIAAGLTEDFDPDADEI
ncbi:MAG: hypothetical protein ABI835_15530, partial [Chloroflexota bacterium]